MSGALIDALAYQLIDAWPHEAQSYGCHDFMARDLLKYLYDQDRDQHYWLILGSGSRVYKTGVFWVKALIDYNATVEACLMKEDSKAAARRAQWRFIFGSTFPI